jgi:hypothetical protein
MNDSHGGLIITSALFITFFTCSFVIDVPSNPYLFRRDFPQL